MVDRDVIWILPGLGWVLWTLGGTNFGKWLRRYVWSIVVTAVAILYGIGWWKALASGISLILIHTLGYSSERKSFAWRAIIGFLFGFALLPILWNLPLAILSGLTTCLVFNGGMAMSLRYSWWTWKYVEGLTGASQGWWIAWALLR